MENKTIPQQTEKSWKSIFLTITIIAMVISGFVYTVMSYSESLSEADAKLLREQSLNSTCNAKRDSLYKEVERLSIYKSLTKAMVHRDEATSLLKYKVGDFVYLKRDSANVLVSDVIIGGAKYEYYIRYKVMYKGGETEEVAPELIY